MGFITAPYLKEIPITITVETYQSKFKLCDAEKNILLSVNKTNELKLPKYNWIKSTLSCLIIKKAKHTLKIFGCSHHNDFKRQVLPFFIIIHEKGNVQKQEIFWLEIYNLWFSYKNFL